MLTTFKKRQKYNTTVTKVSNLRNLLHNETTSWDGEEGFAIGREVASSSKSKTRSVFPIAEHWVVGFSEKRFCTAAMSNKKKKKQIPKFENFISSYVKCVGELNTLVLFLYKHIQ